MSRLLLCLLCENKAVCVWGGKAKFLTSLRARAHTLSSHGHGPFQPQRKRTAAADFGQLFLCSYPFPPPPHPVFPPLRQNYEVGRGGMLSICSCPLAGLSVSACHPGTTFGQSVQISLIVNRKKQGEGVGTEACVVFQCCCCL